MVLVISRFPSSWWLLRDCLVHTSAISLVSSRSVVWVRLLDNQQRSLYLRGSQRQKLRVDRLISLLLCAYQSTKSNGSFPDLQQSLPGILVFCFTISCEMLAALDRQRWLGSLQQFVVGVTYASLYKPALKSHYLPHYQQRGDRRFSFSTYYFMRL